MSEDTRRSPGGERELQAQCDVTSSGIAVLRLEVFRHAMDCHRREGGTYCDCGREATKGPE